MRRTPSLLCCCCWQEVTFVLLGSLLVLLPERHVVLWSERPPPMTGRTGLGKEHRRHRWWRVA